MTHPVAAASCIPTGIDGGAMDCVLEAVMGFMLSFLLAGAGGDPNAARSAVLEWIGAFGPADATELDLVGRIVGFSIVAMDNLRLSMSPELTHAQVLRYRGNAVALSRASDRARRLLDGMRRQRRAGQAKPAPLGKVPRPFVAPAPRPAAVRTSAAPAALTSAPPRSSWVAEAARPAGMAAAALLAETMSAALGATKQPRAAHPGALPSSTPDAEAMLARPSGASDVAGATPTERSVLTSSAALSAIAAHHPAAWAPPAATDRVAEAVSHLPAAPASSPVAGGATLDPLMVSIVSGAGLPEADGAVGPLSGAQSSTAWSAEVGQAPVVGADVGAAAHGSPASVPAAPLSGAQDSAGRPVEAGQAPAVGSDARAATYGSPASVPAGPLSGTQSAAPRPAEAGQAPAVHADAGAAAYGSSASVPAGPPSGAQDSAGWPVEAGTLVQDPLTASGSGNAEFEAPPQVEPPPYLEMWESVVPVDGSRAQEDSPVTAGDTTAAHRPSMASEPAGSDAAPCVKPAAPESDYGASCGADDSLPALYPQDIETMKRGARLMMQAFSRSAAASDASGPAAADPAALLAAMSVALNRRLPAA